MKVSASYNDHVCHMTHQQLQVRCHCIRAAHLVKKLNRSAPTCFSSKRPQDPNTLLSLTKFWKSARKGMQVLQCLTQPWYKDTVKWCKVFRLLQFRIRVIILFEQICLNFDWFISPLFVESYTTVTALVWVNTSHPNNWQQDILISKSKYHVISGCLSSVHFGISILDRQGCWISAICLESLQLATSSMLIFMHF